jgi:hypothetical protein
MGYRDRYTKDKVTKVDLAEDGPAFFRVMDGEQRQAYIDLIRKEDKKEVDAYALLVAYTLCDENGKREYADSEIDAAKKIRGDLLEKLFHASHPLNFVTVDDAKKNS